MVILELKNVSKSFKHKLILDKVTLQIDQGTISTLVGPSGTGKTTLFRIIAGLEKPDQGSITLLGKDFASKHQDRNEKVTHDVLGFIFQNFNLFPHLSVMDNLTLSPLHQKMDKEGVIQRAIQLLDEFGLTLQIDSPIEQLSGGEKQRLAIARALMLQPQLLLFDEPTSALDAERVGEFIVLLKTLKKKGVTSFIITHDQNFARHISEKSYRLDDGKISEIFLS